MLGRSGAPIEIPEICEHPELPVYRFPWEDRHPIFGALCLLCRELPDGSVGKVLLDCGQYQVDPFPNLIVVAGLRDACDWRLNANLDGSRNCLAYYQFSPHLNVLPWPQSQATMRAFLVALHCFGDRVAHLTCPQVRVWAHPDLGPVTFAPPPSILCPFLFRGHPVSPYRCYYSGSLGSLLRYLCSGPNLVS